MNDAAIAASLSAGGRPVLLTLKRIRVKPSSGCATRVAHHGARGGCGARAGRPSSGSMSSPAATSSIRWPAVRSAMANGPTDSSRSRLVPGQPGLIAGDQLGDVLERPVAVAAARRFRRCS